MLNIYHKVPLHLLIYYVSYHMPLSLPADHTDARLPAA
jgi:hypothetical protein